MKLAYFLPLLFTSCSGGFSTIKDGYAYRMTADQAHNVIDSAIRSNLAGDRILPGSPLVASGYDRSLTDTQTYTATAIPVPRRDAFGFELRHEGTMFNGPSKAAKIFKILNERASLSGTKVAVTSPPLPQP